MSDVMMMFFVVVVAKKQQEQHNSSSPAAARSTRRRRGGQTKKMDDDVLLQRTIFHHPTTKMALPHSSFFLAHCLLTAAMDVRRDFRAFIPRTASLLVGQNSARSAATNPTPRDPSLLTVVKMKGKKKQAVSTARSKRYILPSDRNNIKLDQRKVDLEGSEIKPPPAPKRFLRLDMKKMRSRFTSWPSKLSCSPIVQESSVAPNRRAKKPQLIFEGDSSGSSEFSATAAPSSNIKKSLPLKVPFHASGDQSGGSYTTSTVTLGRTKRTNRWKNDKTTTFKLDIGSGRSLSPDNRQRFASRSSTMKPSRPSSTQHLDGLQRRSVGKSEFSWRSVPARPSLNGCLTVQDVFRNKETSKDLFDYAKAHFFEEIPRFLNKELRYCHEADIKIQREMFLALCVEFIDQGAEHEINIPCIMRRDLLQLRDADAWASLTAVQRKQVFQPAVHEAEQMLLQNSGLDLQLSRPYTARSPPGGGPTQQRLLPPPLRTLRDWSSEKSFLDGCS